MKKSIKYHIDDLVVLKGTFTEIKCLKILKENPNMKKSKLRALQQLKKDTNSAFKPADKGSAPVILDKEEYIAQGIRQLSIRNHYRKLQEPIFKKNRQEDSYYFEEINERSSHIKATI